MKTWKRWGLGLLFAVGMACGAGDSMAIASECEGAANGISCNTGRGICQEGICQLRVQGECTGEANGALCDSGRGVCQGGICQLMAQGECVGEADGTSCESGTGLCRGGLCQLTLQDECTGEADGTACKRGQGVCQGGLCKDKAEDAPTISGFNPLQAGFNQEVRIQGANFSTVKEENTVLLAGFEVPADNILSVSANATQITVVVPQNTLCTGPQQICTGLVHVRVNGRAAASSSLFTYVPTVNVSTYAGSGTQGFRDGTTTAARFNSPQGVVVDEQGHLYVTDSGNHRIRTVALTEGGLGSVDSVAGGSSAIFVDHHEGSKARFSSPSGIAIDARGTLYVADVNNHRIRQVVPTGETSTLAGSGAATWGDGTGAAASFNAPYGIAVDAEDNLYIADTSNHRIRKVDKEGEVTTFAGSGVAGWQDGKRETALFYAPRGIALDGEGNLYVADTFNHRIRKVDKEGEVTTLAGSGVAGSRDGQGAEAQFRNPQGMAIDAKGNLFVADTNNNRIRKVTPEGNVTTFAGSASGFADGLGVGALFRAPQGLVMDANNLLYVADTGNHRIRKIVME